MSFKSSIPEKIRKASILAKMQSASALNKYDVCVIGSYATGNVGDRAIGKSIVENLNELGIQSELFSRKVRISESPVRILGGGQLIHEYRKKKVRRDLKLLNECRNPMIIGIGVGPVHDAELKEFIRESVEDMPVVTVRDQRSKDFLEDLVDTEVHSLACPSFLLDAPDRSNAGYTGLSLRPLPLEGFSNEDDQRNVARNHLNYEDSIDISKISEQYIDNIGTVRDEFSDLKCIPFHHIDSKFANKVGGIDGFRYNYRVDSTLQRVANADRMICMRYHSLVFSILANKPAIAIAYAPKVAALADRAGIPWFRPYEDIKFNFERPSNRGDIISDAQENINLIEDSIE